MPSIRAGDQSHQHLHERPDQAPLAAITHGVVLSLYSNQTLRYWPLDAFGLTCVYFAVVSMDACPSVSFTRLIGAPFSSACVACAWRIQCGDTLPGRPARRAAACTILNTMLSSRRLSALSVRERACRDWNT